MFTFWDHANPNCRLISVEQEVIDLPKPIVQWVKANLDNFDDSKSGLKNVQLFVETTSPLLGSNAGHLLHDLRVIVNRFVTGTLKKEGFPISNRKRGHGEQSTPATEDMTADVDSDMEEFDTPFKKGKGKAKKAK